RSADLVRSESEWSGALHTVAAATGYARVRSASSRTTEMSHLVPEIVAQPSAPVAQNPQHPRIHEVREQDAIATLHLAAHFVGGMPGVIGDGERITGIRGESHLRPSGE